MGMVTKFLMRLVLPSMLLVQGCTKEVNLEDLQERSRALDYDEIVDMLDRLDPAEADDRPLRLYLPNATEPFTGRAFEVGWNRQRAAEWWVHGGKKRLKPSKAWYQNGQKKTEWDGEYIGKETGFFNSGQKKWEWAWQSEEVGTVTRWHENGQKAGEYQQMRRQRSPSLSTATWEGVRHGDFTEWNNRGQKSKSGVYVRGELTGLITTWPPSVTRREEEMYSV